MKRLCSPSPLHLRRPFSSLFTAHISTPPPPPSPSPSPPPPPPPPQLYLQSVLDQIKLLSKNPKNYSSLTTLDSLLAKTHLLDSATSFILIDYLSQIKKLGRSKTLISHLKSTGRVSDSFLYSLVFDVLVKDGTVNDVENVWAEICGSVKCFNFSNYLIFVSKFGGVDEIKGVHHRILMGGFRVLERQSYVALCAALCNVNEGLLAKDIVEEMYDNGMPVDGWTYFLMFKCFCRNGDLVEADLVLRKLVKIGFVIDVCIYGSFLGGLCKSGKYREAKKLFQRLVRKPGSGSGLGLGSGAVLKEGRRAIFQLNCGGVVPEMMAYESYFRALCKGGKLDEAEVLLKKMMRGRMVPETCVYGSFIKALFRGGRDEDAMKLFNVMKKKKKGFVGIEEIGRHIVMGLCEKGRSEDGLRVFEDNLMVNGGCVEVCNCILRGYWEEGRVAEAEALFQRWEAMGIGNVVTYKIMLNGYCKHNDVSKAVVVFEEMLKRKMVVDGVGGLLIRGLCECGRVNEAFQYLNQMIENGHFCFWRQLIMPLKLFI